MLSPDEVSRIRLEVTSIFKNLEGILIASVVRRLCKGRGLSSTNLWQLEKLNEADALRRELIIAISKEYKTSSVKEIENLIKAALRRAQNNDLVKIKDLDVLKTDAEQLEAMEKSPELNRITENAIKACKNAMNLTGTRAIEASIKTYRDAVNKAYLEVSTGTFTMADAVKNAVKEIGESGINIMKSAGSFYTTYKVGGKEAVYPLDSAIRRDIVTTLNQSAGELTLSNCAELGCDLVETSWHLGARHTENPRHPWSNHDAWQGKVFSLSGTSEKYPPFKESTGYGEVDGLCGINCRHSFSPYYEEIGLSDHREFPTEEENKRHYQEQQTQRYYERNIRQLKREQIAYRAGGYDKEARETQAKLNAVTAKYNEFLDKTGRTPITVLTEVSGYHYIKAAGKFASNSNEESVNNALKKLEQVERIPYKTLPRPEGAEKAINEVGVLDKENKSCSSLALAYVGRRSGLDVTDYRGGLSCEVFASNEMIEHIANLKGVDGILCRGMDDFKISNEVLDKAQEGKQYYFAAGGHAAIIKKTKTGFSHMFLQGGMNGNGFFNRPKSELQKIFGCKLRQEENIAVLIDIEKLGRNNEFRKLLEHINTKRALNV